MQTTVRYTASTCDIQQGIAVARDEGKTDNRDGSDFVAAEFAMERGGEERKGFRPTVAHVELQHSLTASVASTSRVVFLQPCGVKTGAEN